MNAFQETWKRLKGWQAGVWLPILPPMGALLELVALVAVIFMIDWAIPSIDIAAIEPSPYWIPVLLLSLQYGTVAGLMAAAAATCAHILNGFPEQGIGENLFPYLLRIWSLPILWIGVSLLVGQFRLRQIEVKQEMRHQLNQRTKERDSLAGFAESLQLRCARLEREIATRGGPAGGQLLTALGMLDDRQTDLQAGFAQLCNAAYPGAAMSIFALKERDLQAIASTNWHDGDPWPRTIAPDIALHRATVGEGRALSALNAADDRALGGQGLAAAPLIAPETGRIVGLIKIERASPELLTPDIAGELVVIAKLISVRLAEKRPSVVEPRVMPATGKGLREGAEAAPTRGFRLFPWRRPELVSARGKIAGAETASPDRASSDRASPERASLDRARPDTANSKTASQETASRPRPRLLK